LTIEADEVVGHGIGGEVDVGDGEGWDGATWMVEVASRSEVDVVV